MADAPLLAVYEAVTSRAVAAVLSMRRKVGSLLEM
jgi:hypothetical protein